MSLTRRSSQFDLIQAAVVVGAVLLAVLMGIAAASGKLLVVALVGGAMATLTLVAKPDLIFWATTYATLVIAGAVKYFVPSLDRIWWLAYGMAALLYVPTVFAMLKNRGDRMKTGASPLLGVCIVVFMIDIVFGTIAAASPVDQIIVSVKSLLMFTGLWAYLAVANVSEDMMWKWVKTLFWIGAMQWLPTLYQYIFVRSDRLVNHKGSGKGGVSAADSVVGTFGGSMDAGGLTAVLAFFLVSGLIIILGMRLRGAITRKQYFVYSFLFFFPLMLMEVKVLFVYVPVALIAMFRAEIWRRPHVFIGWSCVAVFGLVVMLGIYQVLHWSVRGGSMENSIIRSFSYSFVEKDERDTADDGAVTRRQGLEMWFKEHGVDNIHEMLIGHGIGASRTRGLALGETAIEYAPQQIDRTGLTQMLWDTGLIGTGALLCAFFAMFLRCSRLKHSKNLLPWQRGLANGLEGVAPMYALSLAYRNDIPYAAPMMFLLFAGLGMTTWLTRQDDLGAMKARATRRKERDE